MIGGKGKGVENEPAWLGEARKAIPLDIRPMLTGGGDPLQAVMDRADQVGMGGLMALDAPFNPSPLRRLLAGRGFSSYGCKIAPEHWRIYLRLDGAHEWEQTAESTVLPEGALTWIEDGQQHVDVRKLPPPQPMIAILRLIDDSPGLERLVAHHDRHPQYLLPELAERGWRIALSQESYGRLILHLEPIG